MYAHCTLHLVCRRPLPNLVHKMLCSSVYLSILLATLAATNGISQHRGPSIFGRMMYTSSSKLGFPPSYEIKYYDQRLDHFNVGDNRTFRQRYLYSGNEWDKKGPIFVYTGNEGDITWFFNNTVSFVPDQR